MDGKMNDFFNTQQTIINKEREERNGGGQIDGKLKKLFIQNFAHVG